MAKAISMTATVLGLACSTVSAQTPAEAVGAPDFPAGAASLEATVLQQRLGGKVFRVAPKASAAWRLQFNDNGFYYINTESGYSDSGKWRIEGSSLCTAPQKTKASCNEVRLSDDALYLKRDSGEVVKFEPR